MSSDLFFSASDRRLRARRGAPEEKKHVSQVSHVSQVFLDPLLVAGAAMDLFGE